MKNLVQSLILGILASFSALIIESLLCFATNNCGMTSIAITPLALFILALIEESAKAFFVIKFLLDEKKIIPSLVFFGIGFSFLEILLIATKFENIGNSTSDLFSITSLHAMTVLVIGLIGKYFNNNRLAIPIALTLAIIIHLVYNLFLFYV